jgi:hypothetical protein
MSLITLDFGQPNRTSSELTSKRLRDAHLSGYGKYDNLSTAKDGFSSGKTVGDWQEHLANTTLDNSQTASHQKHVARTSKYSGGVFDYDDSTERTNQSIARVGIRSLMGVALPKTNGNFLQTTDISMQALRDDTNTAFAWSAPR